MMQEIQETDSGKTELPDGMTNQSLAALLALAGSRQLDAEALRRRMKLSAIGFDSVIGWLQRQYLVDVVSTLKEDEVSEAVELTDKGEAVLVGLLEQMCELPELH